MGEFAKGAEFNPAGCGWGLKLKAPRSLMFFERCLAEPVVSFAQ